MTDKEKQIEEMEKEITHIQRCGVTDNTILAKYLLEKYQPKLPEDSVVLTKEEYNEQKADCECWEIKEESYQRQIAELNKRIKDDLFTPQECGEMIRKAQKASHKETAREIFDKLGFITYRKQGKAYIFDVKELRELAKQFGVEL